MKFLILILNMCPLVLKYILNILKKHVLSFLSSNIKTALLYLEVFEKLIILPDLELYSKSLLITNVRTSFSFTVFGYCFDERGAANLRHFDLYLREVKTVFKLFNEKIRVPRTNKGWETLG